MPAWPRSIGSLALGVTIVSIKGHHIDLLHGVCRNILHDYPTCWSSR